MPHLRHCLLALWIAALAVCSAIVVRPGPAGAPGFVSPTSAALVGGRFGLFHNGHTPDCTLAAAADLAEIDLERVGRKPDIPLLTREVAAGWRELGAPDHGLTTVAALDWWAKHRLDGTRLTGASRIVLTRRNIESAIDWTGGAVYAWIQLPHSIHRQDRDPALPWTLRRSTHTAPLGEHEVVLAGWSPSGVTVVTWGHRYHASWPFILRDLVRGWIIQVTG